MSNQLHNDAWFSVREFRNDYSLKVMSADSTLDSERSEH